MTSNPEIEVALLLTGTGFSPNDVTEIIQLAPTKTWQVGDAIGRSIRKHQTDGWEFGLSGKEAYDLEPCLCELLGAIDPHRDRIAIAVDRFGLCIQVSFAVYVRGETPSVNFSSTTLARMASLNTSLDIDLILSE